MRKRKLEGWFVFVCTSLKKCSKIEQRHYGWKIKLPSSRRSDRIKQVNIFSDMQIIEVTLSLVPESRRILIFSRRMKYTHEKTIEAIWTFEQTTVESQMSHENITVKEERLAISYYPGEQCLRRCHSPIQQMVLTGSKRRRVNLSSPHTPHNRVPDSRPRFALE